MQEGKDKAGLCVRVRSLRERWRRFRKRMPLAGKVVIGGMFMFILSGGGLVAFRTYDFTRNNPSFCDSCHIMNKAYRSWQVSEHTGINCHECHKLAPSDLNRLLASAFISRIKEVPVRYDRVIVPWKTCIACHWETDEQYPEAVKINASRMHAQHYFIERIECSRCHGYRLHKFLPEERFCEGCHQMKDEHENTMSSLPCLNCHTDRTADLMPERGKCLLCHGNGHQDEALTAGSTLDVTHFSPSAETISKTVKIDVPEDAPMKFRCGSCHRPHDKIRPDYGTCMSCHPDQLQVGMHALHVNRSELECTYCHRPHSWKVSEKEAQRLCTDCHDYVPPKTFIGNCIEAG